MDSLFSPYVIGGMAALLIAFYVWGFMSEQKAKRAKADQIAKDKTAAGKR